MQKHDTFAAITAALVRSLLHLCHRLPVTLISLASGSVVESFAACVTRTARMVSNATMCVLPFRAVYVVEQKHVLGWLVPVPPS